MPHTTPAAHERQKEVAALVLSAERVANAMIERIPPAEARKATLVVSVDEFATTTMHMCRLAGAARELHGLLAGGAPSRDELIHVAGHLTTAGNALSDAIAIMRSITDRLSVQPKSDEEGLTQ